MHSVSKLLFPQVSIFEMILYRNEFNVTHIDPGYSWYYESVGFEIDVIIVRIRDKLNKITKTYNA